MTVKMVEFGRVPARQACSHFGSMRYEKDDVKAKFVQTTGIGMCRDCVIAGIRAGTVDVSNPEDLRDFEPAVSYALTSWGCEAIDIFERAIEGLARQGKLKVLAERLLGSMNHQDLPASVSRTSAGKESRRPPGAGEGGPGR